MTTSRSSYNRPAFWKVPSYANAVVPQHSIQTATPTPTPPPLPSRLMQRRRGSTGIKKRVHFADELYSGLHEFAVVLQRDGQGTPWGIRLVGGNDLDTPLIITRVQLGSPSYGELLRGDIIAKIGEYDARDLSHADAQQLFRGAGNEIGLVVHRDNNIAYTQGVNQESGSRCNSTLPPTSPEPSHHPHRGPSPFLPGPSHFERALQLPVDTLPQTVFPQLNASGGYVASSDVFAPKATRDHQQDVAEEYAAIINQ
ncbi:hypothetical protein ACLKA6_004798 [Drosophila palustris]